MREHIYDPQTDFYKFYNNTVSTTNITNYNTHIYNNIVKYYKQKYNKECPMSYTQYINYMTTIYISSNNRYDSIGQRTINIYGGYKIIITEKYLYIVVRYISDYLNSKYYFCVTVNTLNMDTYTINIPYTNGLNTSHLPYTLDMSEYIVDDECVYMLFKRNDGTSSAYNRNIVIVKHNMNTNTTTQTEITNFISSGSLTMDVNSNNIFVMTPHSSTTQSYIPKMIIIDKITMNIIKTITFGITTIGSYGYYIACNNTYVLVLDAKTKQIFSYSIAKLLSDSTYTTALDKTLSALYDEPLTVGIPNINAPYYNKINIDNNNNIYIGDYATEFYNFRYIHTVTNIIPSKFSYDGVLQHQGILPYNYLKPSGNDENFYLQTYEDNQLDYCSLIGGTNIFVSGGNYSMIPSNFDYEDEYMKCFFTINQVPRFSHKGKMPSVMPYMFSVPIPFKHLMSDVKLDIPIKIININDKPILDPIPNQTTDEDTPIDVVLNYSDEESSISDLLIYVGTYDPTMLTYQINGNVLKLIPVKDKYGDTIVTVVVRDPQGAINSQSFTLTIRGINDVPVTYDTTVITNEDTAVTFGLSSKVTDTDNNTFTYYIVNQPTNGNITLDSNNGSITYTPNPNYNGIDSFTFKVNDGLSDSNISKCDITVKPVNDAPVFTANIPDIMVEQNGYVTINVFASDVDDATLSYRANGTGVASYVDNRNGTLTIRAGSSVGSWNINIDVYDANGLYDRRLVKFTVTRLWGDGKLVKTTDPKKLELRDINNYIFSAVNMNNKSLNDIYNNETHLASYYTKGVQNIFLISDFVATDNTDVLNYNKVIIEDRFSLNDKMNKDFTLVIDKLSNILTFETDYNFAVGEETFDVKKYTTVNVIELKLNDSIFFQIDSIIYNINGNEVKYINKTVKDIISSNTFSKSNFAVYEIDENKKIYFNRLF